MQLTQLIDQQVLRVDPADLQRSWDEYYVTGASSSYVDQAGYTRTVGSCMRKEYYRRDDHRQALETGQARQVIDDPDALRMMESGKALENKVVEWCRDLGLYKDREIPVRLDEGRIRGRVDLVLTDPATARHDYRGDYVGVEIKSVGQKQAMFKIPACQTKYFPAKPGEDNLLQLGIYAHVDMCVQPLLDRPIAHWLLYYISRDKGHQHQYTCFYVKERDQLSVDGKMMPFSISAGIQSLRTLRQHLMDRVVPERGFEIQYSQQRLDAMANADMYGKTKTKAIRDGKIEGIGDWQCQYCPYAERCWATQPASKSELGIRYD
jgi:hypothetical protein